MSLPAETAFPSALPNASITRPVSRTLSAFVIPMLQAVPVSVVKVPVPVTVPATRVSVELVKDPVTTASVPVPVTKTAVPVAKAAAPVVQIIDSRRSISHRAAGGSPLKSSIPFHAMPTADSDLVLDDDFGDHVVLSNAQPSLMRVQSLPLHSGVDTINAVKSSVAHRYIVLTASPIFPCRVDPI